MVFIVVLSQKSLLSSQMSILPPPAVQEHNDWHDEEDIVRTLSFHKRHGTPVKLRNVLKGRWPALEKWPQEGYLENLFGPSLQLEVEGATPEQGTPPIVELTMHDFVQWMKIHPTINETQAYQRRTGLLPYLAELEDFTDLVDDNHQDTFNADMGDLELFEDISGLIIAEAAIWWGPAGARTGLHADREPFNLLAQVQGVKTVTLWPPEQRELLYPGPKYDRGAEVGLVDVWEPDSEKFPLYKHARNTTVTVRAGDLLYIPSGWWHTVATQEHSISVTIQIYTTWDWFSVLPGRVLEKLHEWGLYKRGMCTCHTDTSLQVTYKGLPP